MRYAILCHADEAAVGAWTRDEDAACLGRLKQDTSAATAIA